MTRKKEKFKDGKGIESAIVVIKQHVNIKTFGMHLVCIFLPGVFDDPAFANLTDLCVSNNQITTIAPNAFADLSDLESLYLFNNPLTSETRAMLQQLRQTTGVIVGE